jgi:hypothetical protein
MKKSRRDLLKSAGVLGSAAMSGRLLAASKPEPERHLSASSVRKTLHCVVTGQKSGKSVIVSQAPMPPITTALMPGYEFYRIWGEDEHPVLPSDGSPKIEPKWFPRKHGFRFAMFTVPQASIVRTGAAPSPVELEEARKKLPGLLEVLEPDHPGMHTTDSVDFDIVVFGEIVLEVDDGAEATLKAGDCVIQNGTRHAWHNRSADICVIASCLIGAERKSSTASAGE